jgi:hypothetical protein
VIDWNGLQTMGLPYHISARHTLSQQNSTVDRDAFYFLPLNDVEVFLSFVSELAKSS